MDECLVSSGATDPPVFVVGAGRSGTTLVRLILDAHPLIAIPFESHFIPGLWRVRSSYESGGRIDAERLAGAIMGSSWFQKWELPSQVVWSQVRRLSEPTFAGVVEAVFLAYAAERGKHRWGDKTPGYVLEIPLLAELFPEARFVHVMRDGRDVALSLLDMDWGRSKGSGAIAHVASYWVERARRGRQAGTMLDAERYLEIRYEALVDRPEEVVSGLCRFACLPYQSGMLGFFENGSRSLPDDRQRFHRNLDKPITRGLRDWRRDIGGRQLAEFESIAGDTLEEMGYPRALESIPWPVKLEAVTRVNAARTLRRLRVGPVRALRRFGTRSEGSR